MTEFEINQTIAEAMGICYHKLNDCVPGFAYRWRCPKYNKLVHEDFQNPSFTSSWADYGRALEWATGQKWWSEFIRYKRIGFTSEAVPILLNPLRGSTTLAEFLRGRE